MKRIDRLIIAELLPTWTFGVAIFSSLILAGTYLFKLTEYLVDGISFATVAELSMLLIPGVMVKTFPMSMLLACLLSFGRLSGESEIVALRAAGASLWRILAPVGALGVAVAIASLAVNELLVPWAAFRGTAMAEGIEKRLKGGGEPIFRSINNPQDGKLIGMMMAKDFNLQERSLSGVWIVGYDGMKPVGVMYAEGVKFESADRWEIFGGGKLFSVDGTFRGNLDRIWPREIPQPPLVEDIAASRMKDLDSFSMVQMAKRIQVAKANPMFDQGQIRNLEYGYHNKMALPLAAVIFGLLGAPLGIRNHRTGAAAGFALSVLIIFLYMMLTRFMSLWAIGGQIPPWAASYVPLFVGLVAAAWVIRLKNV